MRARWERGAAVIVACGGMGEVPSLHVEGRGEAEAPSPLRVEGRTRWVKTSRRRRMWRDEAMAGCHAVECGGTRGG